jgi:hypothetical protein
MEPFSGLVRWWGCGRDNGRRDDGNRRTSHRAVSAGVHPVGAVKDPTLQPCPTRVGPLEPLPRHPNQAEIAAHDTASAELAHYKLGPISTDDADGYHRVACPAVAGKLRCPLRPPSMRLTHQHPEVLTAPEHPPWCCSQQTITVPPNVNVNANARQKHDYLSAAHRHSYTRRTAVERSNSRIKTPPPSTSPTD